MRDIHSIARIGSFMGIIKLKNEEKLYLSKIQIKEKANYYMIGISWNGMVQYLAGPAYPITASSSQLSTDARTRFRNHSKPKLLRWESVIEGQNKNARLGSFRVYACWKKEVKILIQKQSTIIRLILNAMGLYRTYLMKRTHEKNGMGRTGI
jgi:hypothetical protein